MFLLELNFASPDLFFEIVLLGLFNLVALLAVVKYAEYNDVLSETLLFVGSIEPD